MLRGGTAPKETETGTEASVFDNVVRGFRDTDVADRADSAVHEVPRHIDLGDVEQMSPRDLDPRTTPGWR